MCFASAAGSRLATGNKIEAAYYSGVAGPVTVPAQAASPQEAETQEEEEEQHSSKQTKGQATVHDLQDICGLGQRFPLVGRE